MQMDCPLIVKGQIALDTHKRHTLRRKRGDYGCTTH